LAAPTSPQSVSTSGAAGAEAKSSAVAPDPASSIWITAGIKKPTTPIRAKIKPPMTYQGPHTRGLGYWPGYGQAQRHHGRGKTVDQGEHSPVPVCRLLAFWV
jgi:hypothetical protein